jgi:hypothetical protein
MFFLVPGFSSREDPSTRCSYYDGPHKCRVCKDPVIYCYKCHNELCVNGHLQKTPYGCRQHKYVPTLGDKIVDGFFGLFEKKPVKPKNATKNTTKSTPIESDLLLYDICLSSTHKK